MKILNINKYYQYTGGGDRFFFDGANILLSKGHEVIPYCLNYPNNFETYYAKYFPKGVSGKEIDNQAWYRKAKLFFNGIYSFEAKAGLTRLLSEVTPDVAHLHILHYTMSPSVIDVLHQKNIPIVFSLHDYRIGCVGGYLYTQGQLCQACKGGRYYNAVRYRCYRNSKIQSLMGTLGNYFYKLINIYEKVDIFTVPHHQMLELMVKWGIPRRKLRILKNPFVLKEELPSPSLGKHVLFFGLLARQKGVFTLLEAAINLPEIPFIICGHGEAVSEIQSFINQQGMTNIQLDTVTRWGCGLEELIASSRFVVSPSEWFTPLEYSSLETMMLGKALIASRIGGNQEIVVDGQTGIFFEPGNKHSLEKAIRYLYTHPELSVQMGINAHHQVLKEFSEDVFYQSMMQIYQDAKDSVFQ